MRQCVSTVGTYKRVWVIAKVMWIVQGILFVTIVGTILCYRVSFVAGYYIYVFEMIDSESIIRLSHEFSHDSTQMTRS